MTAEKERIHAAIIQAGLQKKADESAGKKTPSWKKIGEPYGMQGEDVRLLVRDYQKKNGLLKGKYEQGRFRVLIFSDAHIPDHKEEMILDIVRQNAKVNMIVIAGDMLDCKAVSAWYDEHITILDHEMITAHNLLCKIRAITDAQIVLVKGNHEQRVNRYYAQNAKVMGTSVVETEILYKLANGFTIKDKENPKHRDVYDAVPNVVYAEGRSFMYGDLLINHPSIFRKQNMATVKIMWEEKLKNKYPDARVIIIGHTHQLGLMHYEDDRVLIECGCTCNPMAYADNDDRPYKIQQYGYVYLEMKDKKVDIDSIKLKYIGRDELTPGYDEDIEIDEDV